MQVDMAPASADGDMKRAIQFVCGELKFGSKGGVSAEEDENNKVWQVTLRENTRLRWVQTIPSRRRLFSLQVSLELLILIQGLLRREWMWGVMKESGMRL